MIAAIKRMLGVDDGDERAPPSGGDVAYHRAMAASEELLYRIREAGRETDAARAVMSDIWSQSQNVPFMTTVYEAVQEAKTGPEVARDSRRIPIVLDGGRLILGR